MIRVIALIIFLLAGSYNIYLWFSNLSEFKEYLINKEALEDYYFNQDDMSVVKKLWYNFYTLTTEEIGKYSIIKNMGVDAAVSKASVKYDVLREKLLELEPAEDTKKNDRKSKKEENTKVEENKGDNGLSIDTSLLKKPEWNEKTDLNNL